MVENPSGSDEPTASSATHAAYEKLRHLILIGEIAPGSKLKVEVLKERLEIGASPVREALSLLTSDQLVERIDQRGFRTTEVSEELFEDILSLRCNLEDMALRQSLQNASAEWEDGLVLAHHRMNRVPRDEPVEFEKAHKKFHMALISACKSPNLLRFCAQLYDLNIRYRNIAARSGNYSTRDIASEHDAIAKAALTRDAENAVRLLREHYTRTGAYLAGLFETQTIQRQQDPAVIRTRSTKSHPKSGGTFSA